MEKRQLACCLLFVGLSMAWIKGERWEWNNFREGPAGTPSFVLSASNPVPGSLNMRGRRSETEGQKAQEAKNISDIDECKRKDIKELCHKMGKKCFNTVGSFKCLCEKGYHYERKKCRDKDECTWRIHNCSHQSYCRNTEGGFQCVCPKGHELVAGVNCIPDDMTRWTTPKYLLKDIMDGVWSRLLAVAAAAIIVLSLLTISVVCCKRKCEKWAEERELKRLAYEEQLMFAAGIVDPNQIFFEGYTGDEMFYPEGMGYPTEDTGYPADSMGYAPGEMDHGQDNMGYVGDNVGYGEDNMGYLGDNTGYGEEYTGYTENMGFADHMPYDDSIGELNIAATTKSNFDTAVPHTYYEDEQGGEVSEEERD